MSGGGHPKVRVKDGGNGGEYVGSCTSAVAGRRRLHLALVDAKYLSFPYPLLAKTAAYPGTRGASSFGGLPHLTY